MDNDDIQAMINAALDQKPSDFEDAFNASIVSKLHNAINDKKLEIAQAVFSGGSYNNDGSEEIEIDIDDIDDHEEQEQEEE